jgi:outer membrane protein assembly factor BamA
LGYRYFNYLNVRGFALGGDNRLRGYAAGAFQGTNLAALNAEFRTDSVDILSAQVGLAAFLDVAGADSSLEELELFKGIGTGIRILFPQAERIVMRLDLGFPLKDHPLAAPGAFYFTFGQAFSMPDPLGGGDPY